MVTSVKYNRKVITRGLNCVHWVMHYASHNQPQEEPYQWGGGDTEAEASAENCRAFGDRKKRDQMVDGRGEPEVKRGVSDEGNASRVNRLSWNRQLEGEVTDREKRKRPLIE